MITKQIILVFAREKGSQIKVTHTQTQTHIHVLTFILVHRVYLMTLIDRVIGVHSILICVVFFTLLSSQTHMDLCVYVCSQNMLYCIDMIYCPLLVSFSLVSFGWCRPITHLWAAKLPVCTPKQEEVINLRQAQMFVY